MLKTPGIENKALNGPVKTKTAPPPAPKPSPKPAKGK